MKRIVSLLMAVLYLTVSSGLAVEIHHCMGEIKDFSLASSKSHKCDSCGMEKGFNNCCKDELKFVKLQDDAYKLLSVDYQLSIPEADLHNSFYLVNTNLFRPVSITNSKRPSPTGYPAISLCILNSFFRI